MGTGVDPFHDMRLPVIGAPMRINSSCDLVVACAQAGIPSAFPSLNPRETEKLADWLDEIGERCAASPQSAGKYGVNLVVHQTNSWMEAHLGVVCDKKVPFVVTSLGAVGEVVDAVHAYGGKVLHDVISRRHAEKAIEAGVDGLVLVSAGAGGHGGTLNPFAFVAEIREMFDGFIALAGGIGTGAGIAAARAAGADVAYMGTRFSGTREAYVPQSYHDALIASRAGDVVYTDRVSGIHGNFIRQSLAENGVALDADVPNYRPSALRSEETKSVWQRVWSAGHGVGSINETISVAALVDQLEDEYRHAIARVAGALREAAE